MKITRINKIKGYRIFEDFTWSGDLPDFARFNLIYGWNGSGKTTLSNLFRYMQKREAISEGEVEFHVDGATCPGTSLATASGLPQVCVFNRGFVDANVFSSTFQLPENAMLVQIQQLNPIYFLGKDSVEKQKQVEALTKSRSEEQQKHAAKTTAKAKASKAFDDFCIREAKLIKELLSSSGSNPYNNYDKSDFKATSMKLAQLDPPFSSLSDEEKALLKQQKDSRPKEAIATVHLTISDLNQFRQNVETLLRRTVVSQVIEELQTDAQLAEWVRQGLGHHTGEKHSAKCWFCDSTIPTGRIAKLEAHFNDEYNGFLTALNAAAKEITETLKEMGGRQLPDKAKFNEHLVSEYEKSLSIFNNYVSDALGYLVELAGALNEKRSKLFEAVELDLILGGTTLPDSSSATSAVSQISDLINQHNKETENFQKVVAEARKRLEEGLVAETLHDFDEKKVNIRNLGVELQSFQTIINDLSEKIQTLEKDIVEHRQPADELNQELRSYLGRDELKFEMYGNGYQITRHGVSAQNLSEGERTAIAFLYFLKSLQAKDFSIATDIVVIDDPVSSLDANSLFCAFGYMKERTKEAGQLFILTHNFGFFRQAKNWFNHLPHQGKKDIAQRPARFYMVETGIIAGKRSSILKQLDPLLHQFESEYHYLFKKVHEEANNKSSARGLEEFYGMPNIARRLLETFLAFRYPAESGELKQQFDLVAFDPAKKARILRFLHTYSHDGKIAEPEHDLSILAETPEVLRDLIALIEAEDSKHYREMVRLLSTAIQ